MFCRHHTLLKIVAGIAVFFSCSTTKQTKIMGRDITLTGTVPVDTTRTDQFLVSLLEKYPQYFDSIIKQQKDLNVQIIYSQINRGANGIPGLQHYYYNVNPARYFYPASTVKLPVVLLALQKLNELKGKGINMNTTMLTEAAYSGQTAVFNDPASSDGSPSIAQYIKKILMVSDNDAFNRLYEFLGQDYINKELNRKGYKDVRILHRLDIFLTEEENRHTNPVKFIDGAGKLLYSQDEQINSKTYLPRKDILGKAFYKGGELINGPMDFSKKNRISLEDLHNILISIVFPEKVKSSQRFGITEEDRNFVLKYMSQYPSESIYPPYSADTSSYWPAYCKFLLLGAAKEKPPEHIRVFNKSGDAYGHLIDMAYVADYKNKIEFFVSALIYCNSDGILNDDKYDYATVGLPFMKNLGKVIYDYELKRNYKTKPDLSALTFKYDTVLSKGRPQ